MRLTTIFEINNNNLLRFLILFADICYNDLFYLFEPEQLFLIVEISVFNFFFGISGHLWSYQLFNKEQALVHHSITYFIPLNIVYALVEVQTGCLNKEEFT